MRKKKLLGGNRVGYPGVRPEAHEYGYPQFKDYKIINANLGTKLSASLFPSDIISSTTVMQSYKILWVKPTEQLDFKREETAGVWGGSAEEGQHVGGETGFRSLSVSGPGLIFFPFQVTSSWILNLAVQFKPLFYHLLWKWTFNTKHLEKVANKLLILLPCIFTSLS